MIKKDLLKILEESESILLKNNITNKEEINNFAKKMFFEGKLNTEKSALLNSLLGDEKIFQKYITPETAIIEENNKVMYVKENGEELTCEFDEVDIEKIKKI